LASQTSRTFPAKTGLDRRTSRLITTNFTLLPCFGRLIGAHELSFCRNLVSVSQPSISKFNFF
jgi:hypothetical protein